MLGCAGKLGVALLDGEPPTETTLSGVVEDPQFDDDHFDLEGQGPMRAVLDCEEQQIRIARSEVAFGGNDVHLGWDGSAELIQWADFNAYHGDFSRTLRAREGELRLTSLDPCEAGAVAGEFWMETRAGRVEGTLVVAP